MEKAVVVKVDEKTAKLIERYHIDVELAIKLLLCRSQCQMRAKGQCPLEVRD
jgi:hypothetical protein